LRFLGQHKQYRERLRGERGCLAERKGRKHRGRAGNYGTMPDWPGGSAISVPPPRCSHERKTTAKLS
jgi:hypothetical protein